MLFGCDMYCHCGDIVVLLYRGHRILSVWEIWSGALSRGEERGTFADNCVRRAYWLWLDSMPRILRKILHDFWLLVARLEDAIRGERVTNQRLSRSGLTPLSLAAFTTFVRNVHFVQWRFILWNAGGRWVQVWYFAQTSCRLYFESVLILLQPRLQCLTKR
jgi:hypothetical protein